MTKPTELAINLDRLINGDEQAQKKGAAVLLGAFLDNQKRQTLALESIAETMKEQTKLLKGGK